MLDVARPGRRDALKWGMGIVAAAAVHPSLAATQRPLDIANPADARIIYRKLRYRTDDGLLFSWLKGPYMASTGSDLSPLYALNLGSIRRVTQNSDGSFHLIDLEISFRVDVQTGERLKSLYNPITGETVAVGGRGPVPTHVTVSADNEAMIPAAPGQPKYEHERAPVTIFPLGQTKLAIRDRSHTRVTAPDGSVSHMNEVSTISAPSDIVLDPRTTHVNSRVQSNDVRSWPAWLKMGDRPGSLALFANGGTVSRFEDLPDDWHAMLKQYYPQIAADPIAVLDGKVKIDAPTW